MNKEFEIKLNDKELKKALAKGLGMKEVSFFYVSNFISSCGHTIRGTL